MLIPLRAHRPLMLLLCGALVVRCIAACVVQDKVNATPGRLCLIEGDAEGYWELGRRLAQGQDYAVYEPPRRILRMPGFPLVLAVAMKFVGERPLAIRFILAGIGTLACGLAYWFGTELFDTRVGLLAAAFTGVSPSMIVFSVLFLSETLFSALLLASLILLAKLVHTDVSAAARQHGLWLSVAAGMAIGAAYLVRPTWLLVGPGFVAVYLFSTRFNRVTALRGLLVLLGLGVVVSCWSYRNARVTGHFVPTTLWVGPSLYDGLNPRATGASEMSFIEKDRVFEQLSEYDADRFYRKQALDFVVSEPGRTLQLAGLKLLRFWSFWPNAEQFGDWGAGLAIATFFSATIALAAIGGWVSRGRFWNWFLAAAPILYFSAIHMVFVGSLRYRLPAEYALLVLSAAGLNWILEKRAGIQA